MKLNTTKQIVELRTARVPMMKVFVCRKGSRPPFAVISVGLVVNLSGRLILFGEN